MGLAATRPVGRLACSRPPRYRRVVCLFSVRRHLYIAVAFHNLRRYSLLGLPPVCFHLLRVSTAYVSGGRDVRVLICDDAARLLARTCLCLPPVSMFCALDGCFARLLIRDDIRHAVLDEQSAPQLEGADVAPPRAFVRHATLPGLHIPPAMSY